MRFTTAIAIAFSATASLVAAQEKCAAQNILTACIDGYASRIESCNEKPNDYICMCDVYTDLLVCYNNCPDSLGKPPVQNQVTQFCQAAQPLRAAASASVASVASVAATQTTVRTTASETASVTGSATGSAAAPVVSSFQGAAAALGVSGGAAVVALLGVAGVL